MDSFPTVRGRLLSGSIWAFGGRLATVLTVLVMNALLARLLSPQELGVYFLAYSLVLFGALLGSLGLNQAIVRFIAESIGRNQYRRARQAVGTVLKLGALGALVVGFSYFLLGPAVGNRLFHAPTLAAITGLVIGWMAVTTLQTLIAEAFRGFHDIRLATICNGPITWSIVIVCLGLLWLLRGDATLTVVVLLAVGSGATNALVAGWLLHRKTTSLPEETTKYQIRFEEILDLAWPLLITNMTLFAIQQADIWIMGAFRSQEEVAIYGAAARVVTLVAIPLAIVNSVVPPLIAEMYVQGKMGELERALRATATLAGIPAFLILVVFIVLGDPLLALVYGSYYSAGAVVLALLSLGQMANVWAGSCGMALVMTGHQTTMMTITIASGILMITAALNLVEPYGAVGVALAAAAGLTTQNILMWLMARRKLGVWTHAGVALVKELGR